MYSFTHQRIHCRVRMITWSIFRRTSLRTVIPLTPTTPSAYLFAFNIQLDILIANVVDDVATTTAIWIKCDMRSSDQKTSVLYVETRLERWPRLDRLTDSNLDVRVLFFIPTSARALRETVGEELIAASTTTTTMTMTLLFFLPSFSPLSLSLSEPS